MKNITTLLLLVCLSGFQHLLAQDKQFKLGLGYQVYPYEGTDIKTEFGSEVFRYREEVKGKAEAFDLMVGYRIPVYAFSDALHAHVHAELNGIIWIDQEGDQQNFQGQTISSGSSGGVFGFQLPVYATVQYDMPLVDGLAVEAGVGMMYSGINNGIETTFKGSYLPPFYSLGVSYGTLQLQFKYALTKFRDQYPTNTGDIPRLEVSNFSFHIISLFDSWF